ncbi:MAG: type II toxin-antitoxin system HicB family antitoxin [Phycisphaerales bacterium]|nr:type II toxin-antitoxin system HicB family antitoxin [Phycisphaerales bacterium]
MIGMNDKQLQTKGAQLFPVEVQWEIANPPRVLGYCFDAVLVEDEDGGYVASVAQLRGVVSEGDDVESAIRNLMEAFQATIETYIAEDMPIPWTKAQPKKPNERLRRLVVHV